MNYTDFVIHKGYAEDQSLVCLNLNHYDGFESPEKAMHHLRTYLLKEAEKLIIARKDKCCGKKVNKDARFCSYCGNMLTPKKEPEDYIHIIWDRIWYGNFNTTNDLYESMSEMGWIVAFPKTKPVLIFRIERYLNDPSRLLCIIPNE